MTKPIDEYEIKAQIHQENYINTLDSIHLSHLYETLNIMATIIIKSILNKKNLFYDRDTIKTKSHEAATRLIDIIIRKRHTNYFVKKFRTRLHCDVIKVLYGPEYQDYDHSKNLEYFDANGYQQENLHYTPSNPTPQLNYQDVFNTIQSLPKGNLLITVITAARSYKSAILKLNKLISKDTIYKHAVEIRTVYLKTRKTYLL